MKPKLERFAGKNPVGEIDKEAGIIYGVSVVTEGEAKGHHLYIDEDFLKQVLKAGKEKEPIGLKSRFDHPNACSRAMGTAVGRFHEFRRDNGQVRADLHLLDSAANAPDGNLRDYILGLAEEDPKAFATSIVFRPDQTWTPDSKDKGKKGKPPEDDPFWFPHARLKELHHCDVVDQGAANDGLFGRPEYWDEQAGFWVNENEELIVGLLKGIGVVFKGKAKGDEPMDKQNENDAPTVESLQTEISVLTGRLEEQERLTDAAHAQGMTEGLGRIKTRFDAYKDAQFVIDTAALSDEETKDKFIEEIQGKNAALKEQAAKAAKKPADETVDFDGDDALAAGDKGKFEDKVAEHQEAGMSKTDAMKKAVEDHPKLHEQYVERTSKARKASSGSR